MANLLGIDYGTECLGIAIATTPLAEPLLILDNNVDLFNKLQQICQEQAITKIIIGLSEGEMAQKTQVLRLPSQERDHRIPHLPKLSRDEESRLGGGVDVLVVSLAVRIP